MDSENGGWGISPNDFWQMHPRDFWWMFESRIPERKFGTLRASDVSEIVRDLKKGIARHGGNIG